MPANIYSYNSCKTHIPSSNNKCTVFYTRYVSSPNQSHHNHNLIQHPIHHLYLNTIKKQKYSIYTNKKKPSSPIDIQLKAVNAANKQHKMANHNATQIENIEHEIITAERNYCAGLNVLLNELILPIFENKYKSTMVSSIPSLLQFHEGFLTELNTTFNSKHHSMANTFNKYILQNKSEFVRDYNSILDLLGTTLHGNKLLNQLIKRMRKEKKSLLSYLILSIQRIPRYILLLKDLKKDYRNCRNV